MAATQRRAGSHHAVLAGFLGWTLDAFDFFVIVFLYDTLAKQFGVSKTSDHFHDHGHAGVAARWRIRVRIAGRPVRPAHSADGQRGLFFR